MLKEISMKKISTFTTVATFASTILGVGLIAIVSYFVIYELQNDYLRKEKKNALEIAQKALILPVWNYDEIYIQEILNSFIDEQTVLAIKVTALDNGKVFWARAPKVTDQKLSQLPYLDVLKNKINYRGRELAEMEIYYSTAHFFESFHQLGALILLATFLMAVGLASLMNHFIKKWITAPLNEIAVHAKMAGEGNYDLSFKTDYKGELNIVTEAFNETLTAIKKRDHLLLQQNMLLEDLVEKRTRERDQERLKSFQASRLASLGEMAGAIAHEINNPLTIIQNYSRIITRSLHEGQLDLALKSQRIHHMSERIAKIIKGLRAFSRDGKNDDHQNYPVEKLVDDLACLCSSRAKDLNIDLQFSYNPDDTIYVNVTQIGQVIINLINNSIDAIEDNSVKWIRVRIESDHGKAKIYVTDSGNGISAELQDKIMDPFFTTKAMGKGTGLGLSISQRIVTEHGGELSYNQYAPTTEFIINLPNQPQKESAPQVLQ